MLKKLYATTVVATLSLSSLGFAYDFTSADELFKNRVQGYEQATQARKSYERSLRSALNEDEKVYAVTQMTRLDLYRGGMLENVDKSKKKDALEDCVKTASEIRSTNRQEYHYATIACIGFRGKLSSTVGRVKWALKLRSAQDAALQSTMEGDKYVGGFEGGGILRVMSAVRGNRKAKPVGLYNPEEALEFAQKALQTKAMTNRPFPQELTGEDYHENYYYVGQAQIALGIERKDISLVHTGHQTIADAIERLNDLEELEELPEGRAPETAYYKGLMVELNKKVQSCLNQSNWNSCLIKKLD